MSNLLITGAAGFIGSHFLEEVIEDDTYTSILVLDKLTYAGCFDRISDYMSDRVHFIQGDICDRELIQSIFEKYNFTYLINFAAESHVDRSLIDASSFIQTNVEGVKVLLDVAINYKTRILHVSTDEVYGASEIDGYPFTEAASLRPGNPYAASKAAAEMFIEAYKKTYNASVIVTRSSNNYGSNQHKEKFIPKVISNIFNQENIPLYGDGLYYRNWLYVKDHVKYLNSILKDGLLGEVYNISGNHLVSNLDLVNYLIHLIEDKFNHTYHGEIISVKNRMGHDLCYLIDDTKVDQICYYEKTKFEQGIRQTIISMK